MNIVGRKKQEKGFGLILFDPLDRLRHPRIGQILISPQRLLTAAEKIDAANAVVNAVIMAVMPIHPERLAVRNAGGLVVEILVTDPQRIVGIQIANPVIFNINRRHPVVRRRQQETSVEPKFQRSGFDFTIPVRSRLLAKTKMPLADNGGGIARLLQQRSYRYGTRLDKQRVVGHRNTSPLLSKRVLAGQQRKPRGRAGRCRAIAAGEPQSLFRQTVNIRSFYMLRLGPVTSHISISQVIRHDENNIGPFRRRYGRRKARRQSK